MLYLYHKKGNSGSVEIRENLKEMVAAHQVIEIHSADDLPEFVGAMGDLPVLKDGSRIVSGKKAILSHLEEFGLLKYEWDKFQSDACYCGDDGEIL